MKVRMLTLSAGPDSGIRKPGDIVQVTDEEGQALIAGRFAVPAEKAVKRAPENASTGGGAQNASTGGASETRSKRKGKAAQ